MPLGPYRADRSIRAHCSRCLEWRACKPTDTSTGRRYLCAGCRRRVLPARKS